MIIRANRLGLASSLGLAPLESQLLERNWCNPFLLIEVMRAGAQAVIAFGDISKAGS
jgi:hypothetical protein